MNDRESRSTLLHEAAAERVLVFDGSQGVYLLTRGLSLDDFGGPQFEGCPEALIYSRPDVLRDMHNAYLEAGADLIETNTFGGMGIVLAEYGLQDSATDINQRAARLARECADAYATPTKPRFVVGTMGPTTRRSRSPTAIAVSLTLQEPAHIDQCKFGGDDVHFGQHTRIPANRPAPRVEDFA